MLHPYWYDKIASAAADAEAAIADEVAANEAAEAEDQGAIEKIEEDIEIAQEIASTDLPTEVKVEIMEEQGVDPEIIDEVVDADVTDAVAAYYGVNPYWLHDKRAAMSVNSFFLDKLADRQSDAQMAALAAGMNGGIPAQTPVDSWGGLMRKKDAGGLISDAWDDAQAQLRAKITPIFQKRNEEIKDLKGQVKAFGGRLNNTRATIARLVGEKKKAVADYADLDRRHQQLADTYTDYVNDAEAKQKGYLEQIAGLKKDVNTTGTDLRQALFREGMYKDQEKRLRGDIADLTKSRDAWKRGSMIGAGIVGAGLAGYAGYAGLKAYRKRKAAQKAAAEQAAAQQAAALQAGNLRNAGIGAGVGGLGGAALGYALGGGKGALMGGIGGAGLGGAAGYYGNAGVDAYKNWRAS